MWVYLRAEQQEWQPSSTCVAYYKLEDDFLDYSWNGYDLTNNWIVLGTSADGYKGGQLWPNMYATTSAFDFSLTQSSPRTIAFRTGCNTMMTGSWTTTILLSYVTVNDVNSWLWYTTYNYQTRWLWNIWSQEAGWMPTQQPIDIWVNFIDNNVMHSYVFVTNSAGFTAYKDGVQVYTWSSTWSKNASCAWFRIGANQSATGRYSNWYIRQVVIDNSVWTAQDVSDYHNWTV